MKIEDHKELSKLLPYLDPPLEISVVGDNFYKISNYKYIISYNLSQGTIFIDSNKNKNIDVIYITENKRMKKILFLKLYEYIINNFDNIKERYRYPQYWRKKQRDDCNLKLRLIKMNRRESLNLLEI